MFERPCRALFIAAPASGQGKTTVTAALARHYRNKGLTVRVFKTGPDFLDPMIHEVASGNPVYQLDMWMGSDEHCRELIYAAAADADIILIEGVMGLFDGNPSSADLASLFNIPILLCVSAQSMAQSFGAIAHGLATYQAYTPIAGVIANNVASQSHAQLLENSLINGMRFFGALPRLNPEQQLPSRHLGLVQAEEIAHLDSLLDELAAQLADSCASLLPYEISISAPSTTQSLPALLQGTRVAVARDLAFSFCYRANIDVLKSLGAEIIYTSPINDNCLPTCDSLYLPGGYPELHLSALANNHSYKQSVAAHISAGKPCLAECGGMLYLLESLTDQQGNSEQLVGALPGQSVMQNKLANLGLAAVTLPEGTIRGHSYHHSTSDIAAEPIAYTQGRRGKREPMFRVNRTTASYLHYYFPSNPEAIARLLKT